METIVDKLFPAIKQFGPILYKFLSAIEDAPFIVQMEPTSQCNLSCVMCTRTLSPKPARDMSFEEFERVAYAVINSHSWIVRRLFPQVLIFDLTGIGEALLNTRFLDMVEALKRRRVTVTLADNFTLMDDTAAERIIRAGVDVLFISLDASSKQTYEKLRRGAVFAKTLGNIERFVKVQKRIGALKPRLIIRCLVMSENVGELPQMVRLARTCGVGSVSFDHLNPSPATQHLKVSRSAYERAKRQALQLGEELGITVLCAPYPKQSHARCTRPFNSVNVTVEGHVLPCCFSNERKHYSELAPFSMGNAFEQNVVEIWRSARFRQFRSMLSQRRAPPFCGDCYLYRLDSARDREDGAGPSEEPPRRETQT